MTLKVVPKASCDPENWAESPQGMYIGENRPMREKDSLNRNLMWLSEQTLELVRIFKEASRNFI